MYLRVMPGMVAPVVLLAALLAAIDAAVPVPSDTIIINVLRSDEILDS